MAATINNAANQPLFAKNGTTPDVSGALQDYYQNMQFTKVSKEVVGFQVEETPNPINFRGVLQPFTERQLLLKPEGQRAWSWFLLHSDPVLTLQVDDVVLWNGKQTRVMSRKDFGLYGYVEYHIVQDWTGAGP
jgi:hypothetical protein